MRDIKDTIAAISTPPGEGALAVVRLSGNRALPLAAMAFRGKSGLESVPSHTLHVGTLLSASGTAIDTVVASVYRSPHSYTGEDVVEFSTHGGYYVARRALEELISRGARLAEPGEFTFRAFLNGRLDLAQAEAVADLIASRTERSHAASLRQLEGDLSREVKGIRDDLVELCGLLEVELDFSDEDLEFIDRREMKKKFASAIARLDGLLSSYAAGRLIHDGVRVAIVGSPNVGKSSLLNALTREERAIVSSAPGTTRDTIEVELNIGGILFRVVDTAGLRESVDDIEVEGIRRAYRQIRTADIVLLVIDASRPPINGEVELLRRMTEDGTIQRLLLIRNKSDLPVSEEWSDEGSSFLDRLESVSVSALKGDGLDSLNEKLLKMSVGDTQSSESHPLLVSARHKDAVERAMSALQMSLRSLEEERGGEFICVDLRNSIDSLGEIIGVVTTDDILANIFSKFCVGK